MTQKIVGDDGELLIPCIDDVWEYEGLQGTLSRALDDVARGMNNLIEPAVWLVETTAILVNDVIIKVMDWRNKRKREKAIHG